jgi:hypothetical protein
MPCADSRKRINRKVAQFSIEKRNKALQNFCYSGYKIEKCNHCLAKSESSYEFIGLGPTWARCSPISWQAKQKKNPQRSVASGAQFIVHMGDRNNLSKS